MTVERFLQGLGAADRSGVVHLFLDAVLLDRFADPVVDLSV